MGKVYKNVSFAYFAFLCAHGIVYYIFFVSGLCIQIQGLTLKYQHLQLKHLYQVSSEHDSVLHNAGLNTCIPMAIIHFFLVFL